MTPAVPSSPGKRDLPVREAGPADVDALTRLINAAFAVEQIAIEGDRVDPAKVRGYMELGKFLLLEDAVTLLGCAYVELRGRRGYVGLLSVTPTLQGKGLGRRLMIAAEEYARGAGCDAVDLRVISARAELLTFYGKLGYTAKGTSPMAADAPLKRPCHYIHMSKPLH
jgi:GNAT superfamily N-acetyltransferase